MRRRNRTVTPLVMFAPIACALVLMGVIVTAERSYANDADDVAPMVQIVTEAEEPEVVEHEYSHIQLSVAEKETLATILAMEAQGESYDGQKAVVEAIFNRINRSDFPDTLIGVLSQRKQFSTWKYLDHPYNIPNETQYAAIEDVLANGPEIIPSNYTYFATFKQTYAKDHIKLGAHWFGR